jgi:hypothetical protein
MRPRRCVQLGRLCCGLCMRCDVFSYYPPKYMSNLGEVVLEQRRG